MVELNDAEYLKILVKLVSDVAQKESKLDYIESSDDLKDPWVVEHRKTILRQKESIKSLTEHIGTKLVNKSCTAYVFSPDYNGEPMFGIYVGDFRYDFNGVVYPKEFIEMHFKDAHFFEERWVLDLLVKKYL